MPRGSWRRSVNRYLASLSTAFTFGVRTLGWSEGNPARSVKKAREAPGKVRFLSRPQDERDPKNSELRRLLNACRESKHPFLSDLVLLALTTGMRQGEILGLRREQVRLSEGGIALGEGDTKTKAARFVPLAAEALALVRMRYLSASPFLFGGEKRAPFPRKAWEAALRKAGIAAFRFHDLQRTCASYLAMSGASLFEIQQQLGHKSPAMSFRYSHLAGEHQRQVAAKLSAIVTEVLE